MAIHDLYPRRTPMELVFRDPEEVVGFVDEVGEEARSVGGDPAVLATFVLLEGVGGRLRDLLPPDAPPAQAYDLGRFLYHVAAMRRAKGPLLFLSTEVARRLVRDAPNGSTWRPTVPWSSGYAQLPQHLFWAAIGSEAPPEPIDGFFWTVSPQGLFHVLLITGLRPDRPGFSVVPVPEVPFAEASEWGSCRMREDGEDFSTTLPGGEMDELYSLETAGEALKLAARVLRHLAEDLGEEEDPPAPVEDGPQPTGLSYRRVNA